MKTLLTLLAFVPLLCLSQTAKEKLAQTTDLVEKKQYDTAMKLVNQLIKDDSTAAEYYDLRGKINLAKENFKKAIADFNRAVALAPNVYDYYLSRGVFYYSIQQPDSAIEDYTKALQYITGDSLRHAVLNNRGASKSMKRDFEGAYDDFMEVLKHDSTDLGALTNLGAILDNLGRSDEAIPILEKVIRLYPDFVGGYGNLSFRYMDKGDYKKALQLANKVLELDPNQPLGYNNRGFIKYKMNDLEGALKDINKSLEIYPQNSYAYKNRALVYIQKKEMKKACADFNKAVDYGFTEMYGTEVYLLIQKHCK